MWVERVAQKGQGLFQALRYSSQFTSPSLSLLLASSACTFSEAVHLRCSLRGSAVTHRSGVGKHMGIASEIGAALLERTLVARRGNSGVLATGVVLLSTSAWMPLGKKSSKRQQH